MVLMILKDIRCALKSWMMWLCVTVGVGLAIFTLYSNEYLYGWYMNLRAETIRSSMTDYAQIIEIYQSSFPEVERFPVWLLRLMSHLKGINSIAFYDGYELCGFSYFLVNEKTVFILFLAVNSKIRSKEYGSQIIASHHSLSVS